MRLGVFDEYSKVVDLPSFMIALKVDTFNWERLRRILMYIDMFKHILFKQLLKYHRLPIAITQHNRVALTAIRLLALLALHIGVDRFRIGVEVVAAVAADW